MDEISKKDLPEIFQHYLDAGRVEQDGMKQGAIERILSYAIGHRKPDPKFMKRLQEFIESEEPSDREREDMLAVLEGAHTKEAAELLLHEATTLKGWKMRASAIDSVGDIYLGELNEEMAPSLNRFWTETKDPEMMESLAKAMGRSGAPSSVELLLAATLAPDGEDDERREAAFAWGLGNVWTENAVPPFAKLLEQSPAGSQANTIAIRGLTGIGAHEAAQAVIKWLQKTDATAAPVARQWVIDGRTRPQSQAVEAALDPKVPFRSEENRTALREGLEAYRVNNQQAITPRRK